MSRLFTSGGQRIGASSLSISLSNKYSGLISFRTDWFDLLAAQGALKSPPITKFENINSLALNLLLDSTFTSIYDCWKNHSFDHLDLY